MSKRSPLRGAADPPAAFAAGRAPLETSFGTRSRTLLLAAAACLLLARFALGAIGSPPPAAKPAPQPGARPAPNPGAAPAAKLPLRVAGGSGSGDYPPNTLVHVFADPAPDGSIFDRWTGDLEPLIDRYAAHTTLVMPAAKVTLRAAFKRAATCVPEAETLSGVEVTRCLPSRHSGIILLFHGGEGAGASFFRNTEPRLFAADAAAAGFGLIALDSTDREHKAWQLALQGDNRDLGNVHAVLDAFIKRRLVARGEPVYALGVGGGGSFAARVAQRLPCKAVAIFFVPGALPPGYAVPTIWLMAHNDAHREQLALAEYTKLAHAAVPATLDVNDASPVYPLRFQRIRDVWPDESREIYAFLKQKGYLDARDMLAQDPESSGWETVLPERFAKLRGGIREQLDVSFGLARFYSDFDNRILDFFNEHR
jgi:hypothetical protein